MDSYLEVALNLIDTDNYETALTLNECTPKQLDIIIARLLGTEEIKKRKDGKK